MGSAHEQHSVHFYARERDLVETVTVYLACGLIDGHAALLIATPAHRAAILASLRARHIDVRRAQRDGDLAAIDAATLLASFMVGESPDAHLFERAMTTIMARFAARYSPLLLRSYGEMVDLLWKQGNPRAAIRLEELWNALAKQHGFSLLCGYSLKNSYARSDLFEEVCRQHSHVLPLQPAAAL